MAPKRYPSSRLKINRLNTSSPRILRTKLGNELTDRRKKLSKKKRIVAEEVVDDWVDRFLGNLAAIEEDRLSTRRRKRLIRFDKLRHNKSKGCRRLRSPTPYSWDRIKTEPNTDPNHQSRTDEEEEEVESDDNNNNNNNNNDDDDFDKVDKKLSKSLNKRLASSPRSRRDRSHEERELLKKINRHIKTGIAEGKRRARAYICKALNFALERGYLMPADRRGKLLRISPALADQVRNAASSGRRRSVRRSARTSRRRSLRRRSMRRERSRRGRSGRRRAVRRRTARRGGSTLDNNKKLPVKVYNEEKANGDRSSSSGDLKRKMSSEYPRSRQNSESRESQKSNSRPKSDDRMLNMEIGAPDFDKKPTLYSLGRARTPSAGPLGQLDTDDAIERQL